MKFLIFVLFGLLHMWSRNLLSSPRRRGSIFKIQRWIPTFVGMTMLLWPSFSLASESADQNFFYFQTQLKNFEKSHNASLIRRFNENNRKPLSGLSKKEKRFQKEYKELKKNFSYWNEVYHLKQALIETYKGVGAGSKPAQAVRNLCRGEPMCSPRPTHGSATTQMEDEANRLAIKLIQGIMRLAEEYKINTFPLVHNFLINFGLAKRGACKHWAEDILKIIEGIPRDYFVAYWAEHKPGSIAEHNVAVLAPAGATLRDGLLIDPWRTAGKPFWIRVDADHHQWKPWAFYEPK